MKTTRNQEILANCKDFSKALRAGEFISPYQFEGMKNMQLVIADYGDWRIAQDENGQWWKLRAN